MYNRYFARDRSFVGAVSDELQVDSADVFSAGFFCYQRYQTFQVSSSEVVSMRDLDLLEL